jgi:hypothetical protein
MHSQVTSSAAASQAGSMLLYTHGLRTHRRLAVHVPCLSQSLSGTALFTLYLICAFFQQNTVPAVTKHCSSSVKLDCQR